MSGNSAGGGALINLGDLSKPATTLIEKISDAVGGIAKPWQIMRVAKAEAKAELIRTENRFEISEIERRALERVVREEGKKQENIESITAQSIPLLALDAKPENVEVDWLTHFFERCRLVSDLEMQSLWAKVLSGEASNPGTFSKRTIDLVGSLDKSDAELFTKFCQFLWMVGGLTPIIIDWEAEIFSLSGINFASLTHLDDIGLISFGGPANFQKTGVPKDFYVHYYGMPVRLEFAKKNTFKTGCAILTRAGEQLAPVCGSTKSMEYFNYTLEKWFAAGEFTMTLPISEKARFI